MKRSTLKALSVFLEAESGVIINMASAAGLYGSRAGVAYTAAKHAVVGLTKNVGFQYATKGIRCNAIAPGGVNTEIRSEEHTSESSHVAISYAVFCLKKKNKTTVT